MASNTEKRDIGFKHTLDVHHTRTDKQWFEETYRTRHVVAGSDVWAENPAYNDAAQAVIDGTAVQETDFELTLDPFSAGQLWVAKTNAGVWPFDGPLTDFDQLETERVKNWISPIYWGPSSSTGYTYVLKQNDGTPIPDGNWELHFGEGLLHLDDGHTAADESWSTPLKLTAYRYDGSFVGAGGSGDPDALLETVTPITMRVDHATGTSPPSGTKIKNQAEYDALGYDLKYRDDAWDITMGAGVALKYPIRVLVAPGVQYAKPNNLGLLAAFGANYTGHIGIFGGVRAGAPTAFFADFTNYPWSSWGEIIFEDETPTILESGITGTTSNNVGYVPYIDRTDAGTWTVDQHKGSFAVITSGPNAGLMVPIGWNTTTRLYVGGGFGAVGAVTFQIQTPGAVCVDSDGAGSFQFDAAPHRLGVDVEYRGLQFGNATYPFWGMSYNVGMLYVVGCKIWNVRTNNPPVIHFDQLGERGTIYMDQCTVRGSNRSAGYGAGGMELFRSVFVGTNSAREVLEVRDHYLTGLGNLLIHESASQTAPILNLVGVDGVYLPHGDTFIFMLKGANGTSGIGLRIDKTPGTSIHWHTAPEARIEVYDVGVGVDVKSDIKILNVTGSNVVTAWQVQDGARLVVQNPANLVATTNDVDIDGDVFDYATYFGAVGDGVEGVNGSVVLRI